MASEKENKFPPYVGYKTFLNFINGLRETGLPARIDNSLLRNLSGSAQSSLLNALRFFNFIDDSGVPAPAFEKLVNAQDKDRGDLLNTAMTQSYEFLSDNSFDLSKETPATLGQKFTDMGASGGTREKAVAFFLAAGQEAGLTISPHILKHKHASTTPTRRTPRAPAKRQANSDGDDLANKERDELEELELDPLLYAVLKKIPPVSEGWTAEKRLRWFKTFAMNVSQIYDADEESPVELKITIDE